MPAPFDLRSGAICLSLVVASVFPTFVDQASAQEPMPPSHGLSPGTQADLAVTDIFADRLRNGRFWVRITNHGPDVVRTNNAGVITALNGQALFHTLPLHLAPGRTLTYNTGRLINSEKGELRARATVQVWGLNDPRPGNNSHMEIIPKAP
jgi:hypothetical protein